VIDKWFDANTATKADVPGYYCFGFNAQWSAPRIRVGYYDALDATHRFRLIGGPHMELGPTHIANLPKDPFSVDGESLASPPEPAP
jgi:hypothetical protein